MGYDLCIFDLDGTLIDTRVDITAAVNDMLSNYYLGKKGVDEVTGYVGDGIRKLVERCIMDNRADIEQAISVFKAAYSSRLLETTKPYPGVFRMLEQLGGRYKAVLTNKSYDLSKAITDGLDLSHFFTLIIGGDTFDLKKPDTDGIEYIIKHSGIKKEKAVMIGDGRNDLLTAENARVASIYVTYGFSKKDIIKNLHPDFMINDPLELLDIC